jgi:hypothetical protein
MQLFKYLNEVYLRDGIQHTKKGIHHTKKEQNTQKKFPFFFLKIARKSRTDHTKK